MKFTSSDILPEDGIKGILIGRAWVPGENAGPSVISVREDGVYDLSAIVATSADLMDRADPVSIAKTAKGAVRLCSLEDLLENTGDEFDPSLPHLLSPVDLQCIKACGVTFAKSVIERVIEERAGGDPEKANEIRAVIGERIGGDLSRVEPGSEMAEELKAAFMADGLWSQYLEVGIGPYAEVFTKAPVLSSVGLGAEAGMHPESSWNNPEPEMVMVVNSRGEAVGATLGNDVNLRDFEGRSALLLGKAKDNNASCALGPFIRLFDTSFSIEDVRQEKVHLEIDGLDGFSLQDFSSMAEISRDVLDLVAHTYSKNHQYPDGFVLFTGTMFAPTKDRDVPGNGFTHQVGDIVKIRSAKLGTLINRMNHCDKIAPWTYGLRQLFANLAARRLL